MPLLSPSLVSLLVESTAYQIICKEHGATMVRLATVHLHTLSTLWQATA